MDILPLFFDIDEFCRWFEPIWNRHLISQNRRKRHRARSFFAFGGDDDYGFISPVGLSQSETVLSGICLPISQRGVY
jgi:hypothetical protein